MKTYKALVEINAENEDDFKDIESSLRECLEL